MTTETRELSFEHRALAASFAAIGWGVGGLIVAEAALWTFAEPVFVKWLEQGLGAICHHLPERTFRGADSALFPVCARCAGLYAGWIGGTVAATLIFRSNIFNNHTAERWVGVLLMAAGLAVLEALIEQPSWVTSNTTRFVLGLPLGVLPGFCLISGAELLRRRS